MILKYSNISWPIFKRRIAFFKIKKKIRKKIQLKQKKLMHGIIFNIIQIT